jgi:hypothetical protein
MSTCDANVVENKGEDRFARKYDVHCSPDAGNTMVLESHAFVDSLLLSIPNFTERC